jgi:uncharacterized protein
MLIVISPSKTLDFDSPVNVSEYSTAEFSREANELASVLKKRSAEKLSELMGISSNLARLNHERYQQWLPNESDKIGRQALFAFKGDVYDGLQPNNLTKEECLFGQNHLRILSGLYGILKPLDLIQPYRLEMGTPLKTKAGSTLYNYWRKKVTKSINTQLAAETSGILINLASVEYFSVFDQKKIRSRIITPSFRERHNGHYKVISFYAKRARGLMSRFIIQNKISDPESLPAFDAEGYLYNHQLSKRDNIVFTR